GSRSENYITHAVDADIRPINDQEPFAEVQLTAQHKVPTRKIFTSSTTKVDSESPSGSNEEITNPYECEQTLNVSACTLNLSAGPAPQRKQRRTLQCALSSKEEKSSCFRPFSSTFFIFSHARSVIKWINDTLFQPLFNEYSNPPPSVDHLVPEVAASEPTNLTGTPSSTSIDQDAPSPSNLQTHQESKSPAIPPGVKEEFHDIEVAHLDNDPFFGLLIPEPSYEESSSWDVIPPNVHSVNQPLKHISKWTKYHPIDNVIGDPFRPVSTRHQL
ncbi:hypothetical protein Tco_1191493, partial [Tanacetum coccineum]